MIGVNFFANAGNGGFLGSDLLAVSKPAAGSGCPAPATFKFDDRILSSNSFTPVPANEIDTNPTGWTVAESFGLPSAQLRLFKVTRNPATGNPVIQASPTNVTVPTYAIPPNAPQQGSVNRIDTSDTRNTQAVAAIDPAHGGQLAIWTQHTVRGGAGAEVRWYEINPATHSVIQKGKATSPSLFEFNGAISPNRQVNGGTRSGGNAMVMNYNTSSSAAKPGIRMVSKIGGGAQSAPVTVKNSPGQLVGLRLFDGGADGIVPLGRLRRGDARSVDRQPHLAGEPVRRRFGQRQDRARDIEDLELRRHAVTRSRHETRGSASSRNRDRPSTGASAAPASRTGRLLPARESGPAPRAAAVSTGLDLALSPSVREGAGGG